MNPTWPGVGYQTTLYPLTSAKRGRTVEANNEGYADAYGKDGKGDTFDEQKRAGESDGCIDAAGRPGSPGKKSYLPGAVGNGWKSDLAVSRETKSADR